MAVNQYERAFRAWPVLMAAAASRSRISYVELADHLGIHPRPIRYVLEPIQDWCQRERKPPLTVLVVNQRGRPGIGFIAWDPDNLDEGYEEVYSFPWEQVGNPFEFAADGTVAPNGSRPSRHRSTGRRDQGLQPRQESRGRPGDLPRGVAGRIRRAVRVRWPVTPPSTSRCPHIIPWGAASPMNASRPQTASCSARRTMTSLTPTSCRYSQT